MSPARTRVVPDIDPLWLERLYDADPATHALAVWDRLAWPESVEFWTLLEENVPRAYLLVWKGLPGCPVLHWVGSTDSPEPMLERVPPRPLLAIIDPEVGELLRRERGPTIEYTLRFRQRWGPAPDPEQGRPVRRLTPEDRGALRALAEGDHSSVTDTYLSIDLHHEWVVGGFDGAELVAVARAEVRLPRVWHVSGVFTVPRARQRGWGRAVVAQLLRDADSIGAGSALFVRDDNTAARALYDALGFDTGVPRLWVDAGAERSP